GTTARNKVPRGNPTALPAILDAVATMDVRPVRGPSPRGSQENGRGHPPSC
ncbi:unnamed protein product, partial [marine sediment metagenome]